MFTLCRLNQHISLPENTIKEYNYIETIRVTKVANGHVIQIKMVGISTEQTFICSKDEALDEAISAAINKVLTDKL